MSKIVDVTENFDEFVKDGICVVDFWANWCGPCKMLAPILDEVADKTDGVKFGKVDVDRAPELSQRYKIYAIPNVCIFKNGELVDRVIGLSDEEEITSAISKNM